MLECYITWPRRFGIVYFFLKHWNIGLYALNWRKRFWCNMWRGGAYSDWDQNIGITPHWCSVRRFCWSRTHGVKYFLQESNECRGWSVSTYWHYWHRNTWYWHQLLISFDTTDQASWRSGRAMHSYSGGARFQSRSGHQLPRQKLFVIFPQWIKQFRGTAAGYENFPHHPFHFIGKFAFFYRPRRFLTVFTKARYRIPSLVT
jgi:hypothetical protein